MVNRLRFLLYVCTAISHDELEFTFWMNFNMLHADRIGVFDICKLRGCVLVSQCL